MERLPLLDGVKNLKLNEVSAVAITFLLPAVITFVWVSLPLFLIEIRVNLLYLGVIYSTGIISSMLVRIPLRFYLERGRKDILPMLSVLIAGISLSVFYISLNLAMVILAFVILSISGAMYRAINPRKQERNLRNTEPMRNLFSQNIVSTVGIFALLIMSGLYPGGRIVQLYGIVSVGTLLIGFLTLAYTFSSKPPAADYIQKTGFKDLVRNAISPIKSFDMVVSKKIVFPFLTIQSLLYLSICIVAIFLPALAIRDNISYQDIFFVFAAFSIIGFLLDKVAQQIKMQPVKDVFYMFRPVFLIIPFLILSIVLSSFLFIIGYFVILLWIFSDSASSDIMLKSMGEGDRIRSRIIASFLSVPISIIGPLLGSIMWFSSPRLLYGVAIVPAAVSMLIVTLMLERNPGLPSTHTM